MARQIIGATRLAQRTAGAAINANFKELYDLIASLIGGGGGSTKTSTVDNLAELSSKNIPAPVVSVTVLGYAAAGDSPPARYRRATSGESGTIGAISGQNGSVWIIDETTLLPEWFGAKGNSNGTAGSGTDDAPAFRAMLEVVSARKLDATTLPAKSYRFASHVQHSGGQKTVLLLGSDTYFTIKSVLVHDSFDAVAGSPMFIFTNGVKNNRCKRVHIKFEGHGQILYPAGATKPRTDAKKGAMAVYYTDYFSIIRSSFNMQSGTTFDTGFQTTAFHSSYGLVDGGFVGVPGAPDAVGSDGFHVLGTCTDILVRGLLSNSGDDSISLTCESNMDGDTLERITITDCVCSTYEAKIIKIHITGIDQTASSNDTTKNCTIQDIVINNIIGHVRGTVGSGAAIVVLNENRDANNIIRRVKISNMLWHLGNAPKTKFAGGTENGHAVLVQGSDDVEIANSIFRGYSTGGAIFYRCNGGGLRNCTIESSAQTNRSIVTGVSVSSAVLQGGSGYRRFTFSGSPDLSSVETILNSVGTGQLSNNRYPIITVTGMAGNNHNGSFIIRGVDNTAKWVDVENLRPSTPDEASGSTGTATIIEGQPPVISLLDCNGVRVNATVVRPQGWAAGHVGGRNNASSGCEMVLKVVDAIYGYGINVRKATRGRYSVVGQNCKSGSYMIKIEQTSGISNPLNHILESEDVDGIAESISATPAGLGWARTAVTDYATDKVDIVRGRQSSRISGTVTQASGATTFSITAAGISGYAGYQSAGVTVAHLQKLIPSSNGPQIVGVVWDSTAAKFDVTTTATTAACVWHWTVAPPV